MHLSHDAAGRGYVPACSLVTLLGRGSVPASRDTTLGVLWICQVTAHGNITFFPDRLAGQVVKASASGEECPGFEPRLRRDFSGSSHTGDLKVGTPVATLPGAWHYRVSAGTGRPCVSIL